MDPNQNLSAAKLSAGRNPPSDHIADLPLAIANMKVDPELPIPIYQQICTGLRDSIVVGDLPAGTRFPTSRELAIALGVSRNTVVAAYSQLAAEGYLVTNRRRGTIVADLPFNMRSMDTEAASRSHSRTARPHVARTIEISFRAQRALQVDNASPKGNRFIIADSPDPAFFPRTQLSRLLADEFGQISSTESSATSRHFQATIAAHLRQKRGVCCTPEQVIPVVGIKGALNLVARVMIDSGHCVAVEDPAPPVVRQIFLSEGAHVMPLPSDIAGADPGRWNGPPPRLIFVSPSANCPLGRQMSDDRRTALFTLAHRTGGIIFEADESWELTYRSSPQRALQGCDETGHVIYFGTLNNILGPHIHAAYLVVPPDLVVPFSEMAGQVAPEPESFILAALTRYLKNSQYSVHVRTMRTAYARRLRAIVDACNVHLRGATVIEPVSGLNVTLLLWDAVDEHAASRLATMQNLPVVPLSYFYQEEPQRKGLVLALGSIADRNVDAVIRRLAEILGQTATV